MGQVVKATLDKAHSNLSVSEPADQRAQQFLSFIDKTFREMNLNTQANYKMNFTQSYWS